MACSNIPPIGIDDKCGNIPPFKNDVFITSDGDLMKGDEWIGDVEKVDGNTIHARYKGRNKYMRGREIIINRLL